MDTYLSINALRARERLAELNTKDLREYFKGFRKLYNELLTQRDEHRAEIIVQQQRLQDFKEKMQKLRECLTSLKKNITEQNLNLSTKSFEILNQLKKDAPQLAEKLEELRQMQRRLAFLKFSRNFTLLLGEVRKYLRKGNYSHLLDNYKKLLKIPNDSPEYCMDAHCRQQFAVKAGSLSRFLQLELRSALSSIFSRVHFPFEEPVDLNSLHFQLHQSAQIIKCLQLITSETIATTSLNKSGQSMCAIEFVLDEFRNRFDYHFHGDRPTNNLSKPEWFFTQLSYWADNNMEYFEQYIQPVVDELFSDRITKRTAKDLFLELLMSLASQKLSEILSSNDERILENHHQLSHLIDETVMFEKEFQQNFGYSEEASVHVVSQLCRAEEVLERWIKLERDTLWVGIDAILADDQAYEPRYKEAADVDPYLLPNFADSFVILMQAMSERYQSIPELCVQCRFLKLQLVIVDEFRSRIVQIGQNILHNPWERPYPQLMNALWYLSLVLDDWSESPEFVRLQFHLQSGAVSASHFNESSSSCSVNSLARGTFDESAGLYRHVWRQWVRNLCAVFAETIRLKLTQYADERWDQMKHAQPDEVTPSLGAFLKKVQLLLDLVTTQISHDSVLTLLHLTNHEVWSALEECVILQTSFNSRGASQLLFDVTTAVIPLLTLCYAKMKGSSEFDLFGEKCVSVLSALRILSLPPPAAILLKDELKHIPEHQLNEKLEQFNVSGMTKTRVRELLEQRCDLLPLEKLIS